MTTAVMPWDDLDNPSPLPKPPKLPERLKLTYTAGQLAGYQKFSEFYLAPLETVMLLLGYSGTGKSTLVDYIIRQLPLLDKTLSMIDSSHKPLEVILTATTNEAAQSLFTATGGLYDTRTIHSVIGARVDTDYKTGRTELVLRGGASKVYNTLIFCDEASYVDSKLLALIHEQCENCKIVFIGDPAQLTPITSTFMPAFEYKRNVIELTEPTRTDPLSDLGLLIKDLRHWVLTGEPAAIKLSPNQIEWTDQKAFEAELYRAFSEPDAPIMKVLAYTNKRVMHYNDMLCNQIHGTVHPQEGHRMQVNSRATNKACELKTGENVVIASVDEDDFYGVPGYTLCLRDKPGTFFMPKNKDLAKQRLKEAQANDEWSVMKIIQDSWLDLRPSFACTVNKSQGSTYHTVFIDLGDVSRVNTNNQLARFMYVGTSRAKYRVVYTGDVV